MRGVAQAACRAGGAGAPSLTTDDVALSLALYIIGYVAIFGSGLALLRRRARIGPAAQDGAHAAAPEQGASTHCAAAGGSVGKRRAATGGQP